MAQASCRLVTRAIGAGWKPALPGRDYFWIFVSPTLVGDRSLVGRVTPQGKRWFFDFAQGKRATALHGALYWEL